MKDLKILVVGTFAVLTTVGLNFRHALNDYGVLDNRLHVEVLAQSNNSGGNTTGGGTTNGSNNSGSGNLYHYEHLSGRPQNCTLYKGIDMHGTVRYSSTDSGFGSGWTVTQVKGTVEDCPNKGSGCTVYSCHVTTNTGGNT